MNIFQRYSYRRSFTLSAFRGISRRVRVASYTARVLSLRRVGVCTT